MEPNEPREIREQPDQPAQARHEEERRALGRRRGSGSLFGLRNVRSDASLARREWARASFVGTRLLSRCENANLVRGAFSISDHDRGARGCDRDHDRERRGLRSRTEHVASLALLRRVGAVAPTPRVNIVGARCPPRANSVAIGACSLINAPTTIDARHASAPTTPRANIGAIRVRCLPSREHRRLCPNQCPRADRGSSAGHIPVSENRTRSHFSRRGMWTERCHTAVI